LRIKKSLIMNQYLQVVLADHHTTLPKLSPNQSRLAQYRNNTLRNY